MASFAPANSEPPLSDVSKGNGEEIIRDYQPLPGVPWRFGESIRIFSNLFLVSLPTIFSGRYGAPPNYEVVNKAYFAGRTKVHAAGSLEAVVQNLVKNWEVESHHIEDVKYWQTMKVGKNSCGICTELYTFLIFNTEKVDNFTAYANNLKCPFSAEKMAKIGRFPTLSIYHYDQRSILIWIVR